MKYVDRSSSEFWLFWGNKIFFLSFWLGVVLADEEDLKSLKAVFFEHNEMTKIMIFFPVCFSFNNACALMALFPRSRESSPMKWRVYSLGYLLHILK